MQELKLTTTLALFIVLPVAKPYTLYNKITFQCDVRLYIASLVQLLFVIVVQ